MTAMNYQQAGVNIRAGDELVKKIVGFAKKTKSTRVKESTGGFASLYQASKDQWIAASTDGVGTKLKLAFMANQHKTIGIDLVAMSVNDLICVGAEPWFFLDYFATGKLQPRVAAQVIQGIADGCSVAGCALIGGETAEMPGMYSDGEYDLAGFAVGGLSPKSTLPVKSIRAGDVLIGLRSTGCHSNGYSLLRKWLPRGGKEQKKLIRQLLEPTQIYVDALKPIVKSGQALAIANITGGGMKNIARVHPRLSFDLCLPSLKNIPKVFEWVYERGDYHLAELAKTFNMGVGMVLIVRPADVSSVLKKLERRGFSAWELGRVIKRRSGKGQEVIVSAQNCRTTILKA